MKYLLLLGRGVEGCGVTKFAIEWEKWFIRNGYDYDILAVDDKKWSRKDSHSFQKLTKVRLKKDADFETAKTVINACDIVIINSLPPIKIEQIIADRFIDLLNLSKGKSALIQHDHNARSIKRNAALLESCEVSSVIFSHSTTDSDFVRYLTFEKIIGNSESISLFGNTTEDKPLINFQPGMYLEDVRKDYWKPIEEQDSLHHKWIGRTAPFKGYDLMFEFSSHLKEAGFLTTMEGLESSPAIINVKQKYDFHNHLHTKIDEVDISNYYGGVPTLFSFYKHAELLERLSKCAFGYQLSRLDPRFIEHSIEYTHMEVVCAGTIPVFRKQYFDHCVHTKTGNPISSDKDTGTIFICADGSNFIESIEKMKELSADSVMRNEWREMAYEYYNSHQSADKTFSKLIAYINHYIKD